MSLLALLQAEPGAVAIRQRGAVTLYGDLRATVEAACHAIGAARPIVATLLPNRPSTALALLSLCEAAVAAPLNPALTLAERRAALARVGASALLADASDEAAAALARSVGVPFVALHEERGHVADFRLEPARSLPSGQDTPPGTALILATSGSTGAPKAVPLSKANLMHSARAIAETL